MGYVMGMLYSIQDKIELLRINWKGNNNYTNQCVLKVYATPYTIIPIPPYGFSNAHLTTTFKLKGATRYI